MCKCGNYTHPGGNPNYYGDCYYHDQRCCYFCDKESDCRAEVRCDFEGCVPKDKVDIINGIVDCKSVY